MALNMNINVQINLINLMYIFVADPWKGRNIKWPVCPNKDSHKRLANIYKLKT